MKVQKEMQEYLSGLAIPLTILWTPKANGSKHGEIVSSALFIYDKDLDEAWCTLEHEILEFRLKEVT